MEERSGMPAAEEDGPSWIDQFLSTALYDHHTDVRKPDKELLPGFGSQAFENLCSAAENLQAFSDICPAAENLELLELFHAEGSGGAVQEDSCASSSIASNIAAAATAASELESDPLWAECGSLADLSELTGNLLREEAEITSRRPVEDPERPMHPRLYLRAARRRMLMRRARRRSRPRRNLSFDSYRMRYDSVPKLRCVYAGASSASLPPAAVAELERWVIQHMDNPYPTLDERLGFVETTALTRQQVQNWFSNFRYKFRNFRR